MKLTYKTIVSILCFQVAEKNRIQRMFAKREDIECVKQYGVRKKELTFSSQKSVFEALESGKFQKLFQNENFDGVFTGDNSMVLGFGYQGQGKS